MRVINIALIGLCLTTFISCNTHNKETMKGENEVIETIMGSEGS